MVKDSAEGMFVDTLYFCLLIYPRADYTGREEKAGIGPSHRPENG